jgi:hypothetical protein
VAIVSVTIAGNAKPFKNALDESESRLSAFGGGLAKFAKIGAAAFAAAGAAAVVLGSKLIKAGEQAATSNARIEQIAKSMNIFGGETQAVTDRLVKLAEQTALNVGLDQNIIKSTQAKLLTFGALAKTADVAGGAFDRATKAAIDLAAAGFGEASSNAVQLGKALQDPIKGITALAKSGVTFTDAEKERIKTLVESNQIGEAQALVLEAIEKQVGGTAEATANATDKIKVAFSQVQERLGQALLPIFERFATFVIEKFFPALESIGNKAMPFIIDALSLVGDVIEKKVLPVIRDLLIPAFQRLAGIFLEYIVPTIRTIAIPIFRGLVDIFDRVVKKIQENRQSFSRFLDMVQNVYGFIRDKLAPVIGVVLEVAFKVAGVAIGGFLDAMFKIMDVFTTVFNFVVRLSSRIVDVIVGLVNGVIDAINTLIRGFNALPASLRFGQTLGTIGNITISGATVYGGSFPNLIDENRGKMPTVIAPTISGGSFDEGAAGGGGGGGGGGGSRTASGAQTGTGGALVLDVSKFTADSFIAAHESMFGAMEVTVNVNGALATEAEIGDAVYQALLAAQGINGPLQLSIA